MAMNINASFKIASANLDGKSETISFYASRIDNDGDVFGFITFTNGGEVWRACKSYCVGSTYSTSGFINYQHDKANFASCITNAEKKRPARAKQDAVIEDLKRFIYENVDAIASKIDEAVALAKKADGFEDKREAEKMAELERELEAARREAEKSDINSLIMRNVVDALTPEICNRIRERVGAIADAAPTRLEVKIGEQTIKTSEAVRHEKFDEVLNILAAGFPVWLVGDAGTGKSKLCEQLAEAMGAEYRYSGAILDEFAGLKGFIDANGRKHGTVFTEALDLAKNGEEVLLCLDECDGSTPEVLLVLNNLLSGGAVECMGEVYTMSDNLHVIACGNTNGRGGNTAYTRSIIDSATLDRFYMIEVDYSQRIEVFSARGDEQLAGFARAVRVAAKKCGIDMLVTYRAIARLAVTADKVGTETALVGGLLRGLDASDVETLKSELPSFGKWTDALAAIAARA